MCRYTFLLIFLYSSLMEHQSIELYDRLYHLIDYVKNHTESQKPDLMLGIYLCEAQLKAMHFNGTGPHDKLEQVLDNVKHVREQYENKVAEREHSIWELNVHNSIVVQHLLNLSLWVTSLESNNDGLFFGNLTTNYPLSLTLDNFADHIDDGAPSPSESDECLAELLNSIQCTISDRCLQIMSLNNESHGYHLTHKLLYFMVMKYHDCGSCLPVTGMSLDFMIYTLCSMVWHERNLIIEMDIPNQLKDLLIEQTLLCGISGYAAFIDETTVRDIVQWQVPESGCYEYFDGALPNDNDDMDTKKQKRSAALLEDNCSDHMTGLAAATFGLFAKISSFFHDETV
ncbi:UPF0764 protein C16orf89 homolog [Sitodiplosis mosellana]|uniref:UPF0764 protein C16orf89 homolog n=1 Tax=Sitodiplosis mosellana TaxID=263140 RepID=UPI002443A9FC|nr:UPF0764 protein C16orf89 homolog [Sitodiplosis mosellana]